VAPPVDIISAPLKTLTAESQNITAAAIIRRIGSEVGSKSLQQGNCLLLPKRGSSRSLSNVRRIRSLQCSCCDSSIGYESSPERFRGWFRVRVPADPIRRTANQGGRRRGWATCKAWCCG